MKQKPNASGLEIIVYVFIKSTERFKYYFYAIEVKMSLNFKFIGSLHQTHGFFLGVRSPISRESFLRQMKKGVLCRTSDDNVVNFGEETFSKCCRMMAFYKKNNHSYGDNSLASQNLILTNVEFFCTSRV